MRVGQTLAHGCAMSARGRLAPERDARAPRAARAAAGARRVGSSPTRGVLEVDTPLVVNAPVTDVHIHSAAVRLWRGAPPRYFLHTSPEYAMKRLLAAGSGDIYQICHVVRGFERGRLHNAEFTLIEWYRIGFSLEQLMDEVEALVRTLLGAAAASGRRSERLSYRARLPARAATSIPFTATAARELHAGGRRRRASLPRRHATARRVARAPHGRGSRPAARRRRPHLRARLPGLPGGAGAPRSAGSARRAALRAYCEGIELANGFHELASAAEQRARFEQDNAERRRRGPAGECAGRAAAGGARAGLPECAGVALGFDRPLMLARGGPHR